MPLDMATLLIIMSPTCAHSATIIPTNGKATFILNFTVLPIITSSSLKNQAQKQNQLNLNPREDAKAPIKT